MAYWTKNDIQQSKEFVDQIHHNYLVLRLVASHKAETFYILHQPAKWSSSKLDHHIFLGLVVMISACH